MDASMEEIVRTVTERVIAALKEETTRRDQAEGKGKCLVLGAADSIPEPLTRGMLLLDLEDYRAHQNPARYQRVLITELSLTDLADIALGRAGTEPACAVCQALLRGTEVLMLERALPHRAFAGQGSTALFHLLESYANTLQIFGIKLIRDADPLLALKSGAPGPKEPTRREVSGVPLITEAMARDLAREAQEVAIPAGTLITPAAMDEFKAAHTTLIRR